MSSFRKHLSDELHNFAFLTSRYSQLTVIAGSPRSRMMPFSLSALRLFLLRSFQTIFDNCMDSAGIPNIILVYSLLMFNCSRMPGKFPLAISSLVEPHRWWKFGALLSDRNMFSVVGVSCFTVIADLTRVCEMPGAPVVWLLYFSVALDPVYIEVTEYQHSNLTIALVIGFLSRSRVWHCHFPVFADCTV